MSKVAAAEVLVAAAIILWAARVQPPPSADRIEVRWRGKPMFVKHSPPRIDRGDVTH
jgi:hypothetical protein